MIYKNILSNYETILSYCLKGRKNTESKNPKIVKMKITVINVVINQNLLKSKKLAE